MIGQRFHTFTVMRSHTSKRKPVRVWCKCDCGRWFLESRTHIKEGQVNGCGKCK